MMLWGGLWEFCDHLMKRLWFLHKSLEEIGGGTYVNEYIPAEKMDFTVDTLL